jgi:DNA-binding beta-propeller fold protein YncE
VTLRHVGFTPVPPGAKRGFDHADTFVGDGGSRLYVAHTGADRVDVLDCKSGAYLRALPDLPGVAGVLVDSEHDLLLTTDRAAARVSIFRASDETLLGQVAVGPRPNGLAFDAPTWRVFSFNLGEPAGTNCTASAVSVVERRVVATIALPGRPRWAVFDDRTRSVYANIADPPVIAVIDADTLAIRRLIPVPAAGPHGLALVPQNGAASLWCAADAGQLAVIDPTSGDVQAALPLPGTPDVVMYDRDLARMYVAVGSPGTVSVIDTRRRRHLETIATEEGAHTIGWDPASRRLFVFEPRSCGVAIFAEVA